MPFRSSDTSPRGTRSYRPFAARLRALLANEAFECYLVWRSECAVLEAAYRTWVKAPRPDVALAYAGYTAALDREECAARHYRTVVTEAEDLLAQAR